MKSTAPNDPILTASNPAGDARLMAAVAAAPCQCCHPAEACPACDAPLVALGPDSTDRLSPPVSTDADAKTRATVGAGVLGELPSVEMDATDAAIVRGDRSAINVAVCAERRAWIEHASRVAIEVLREIDNAIGGKP